MKRTMVFGERLVVPHVGTWIEIYSRLWETMERRSFPTWERGLKLNIIRQTTKDISSFPTWERGLKSEEQVETAKRKFVVPHVGTWIEIEFREGYSYRLVRRSPRGNVD